MGFDVCGSNGRVQKEVGLEVTPVKEVVPRIDVPLVVFGADQPEYMPLPAYRVDDDYGTVVNAMEVVVA